MKAAVLNEFSKPLAMEDVTLEPPGRNEVKLRMIATGLCHSDIHSFKGEHGTPPLPAVGGHEITAYVEEIGEGVSSVKAGDIVVASLVPAGCGKCYYCNIGLSNQCQNNRVVLAIPGKFLNKKGQRLTQLAGAVAGFVEYATVPEVNVVPIPEDMPADSAALLGCCVISGFGAVVNRAKVQANSSVLVMGSGGVGLNAIQGAVYSGAYPIIAVDIQESKLEAAKFFGATHTINPAKEKDPIQKAREITYNRGADCVIIAVAGVDILRQGFMMSSVEGTVVIIGHGHGEKLSAFTPTDFMVGKKLTGSVMGATRPRLDIPRLIELYKCGLLKLDELVSGHYPFDRINDAIASMEKGDAIRNVIMF
jgi:S-(hydroxymethyl)glutathione dehydrogenase/alcohol dehydrogenase